MRWGNMRRSSNVVFRGGGRRGTAGRIVGGGGIGTVVLVLVALYFGVDPSLILGGGGFGGGTITTSPSGGAPIDQDDPRVEFVSRVLGDTEDTWRTLLPEQAGQEYEAPPLVVFDGVVNSACGTASSATGPFYCPGDRQVYIDLSFFDELERRFGAPGDFAQAYVIAHEVGHHLQTLLGISQEVNQMRANAGETEANRLSVMLELQADCLAGVWARNAQEARQILEEGDIDEGLNAAAAIGDDRLQRQSRGYVTPDSFTHGSSAQRVKWFKAGLEGGEMARCDTFNAPGL